MDFIANIAKMGIFFQTSSYCSSQGLQLNKPVEDSSARTAHRAAPGTMKTNHQEESPWDNPSFILSVLCGVFSSKILASRSAAQPGKLSTTTNTDRELLLFC